MSILQSGVANGFVWLAVAAAAMGFRESTPLKIKIEPENGTRRNRRFLTWKPIMFRLNLGREIVKTWVLPKHCNTAFSTFKLIANQHGCTTDQSVRVRSTTVTVHNEA